MSWWELPKLLDQGSTFLGAPCVFPRWGMKKNKDPGIKTKKTFREHGPFEDAFPSKNEWVFSVILVYNQVYHHFQGIQGGKDDNFLVKTSESNTSSTFGIPSDIMFGWFTHNIYIYHHISIESPDVFVQVLPNLNAWTFPTCEILSLDYEQVWLSSWTKTVLVGLSFEVLLSLR